MQARAFVGLSLTLAATAQAGFLQFGDADVLGFGLYPSDPLSGATTIGLSPGSTSFGAPPVGHGFPFAPEPDDFPGTDQIYVGSLQTASLEGYSSSGERIAGPQTLFLNYASLIPPGDRVTSFTLGLAADDFQFPSMGQPYTAKINGNLSDDLTNALNAIINQTGPVVQYFAIGLSPSVLSVDHMLVLSIDQGGNGGDGWALDFVTVGVSTSPIPEPSSYAVFTGLVLAGLVLLRRARNRPGHLGRPG